MNKQDTLLRTAQMVVQKAQEKGAQGIRASVKRSRNATVEWRDNQLDRIRESTSMTLGVTLYVDERYSGNSTSDLREQAIDAFLDDIIMSTRILARDPHRKLPDVKRYANRFQGDLKLLDEVGNAQFTPAKQRQLAKQLVEAARSGPRADEIISSSSWVSNTISTSALVASNGMQGTTSGTSFTLVAETAVKDKNGRKPEAWEYAVCRQGDRLPALEKIAEKATRRAFLNIGAGPEKSGQYPCIIESTVAGKLLRWLLRPLNGRSIQQKQSFLANKMGQPIAAELLTIIDDPHVLEGLGSRTYDGEGMSTIKRPIIDQGVVKTFFLDTYYASKLNQEATASSYSNLVFNKGSQDLDGLMRAMGNGILVTGFSGGNSNPTTGDFSIGIKGLWIEKGQIARPVAEMNLAGNHLKFWNQLTELGNDPFVYSSIRVPSLRFKEVQFSGV